MAKKKSKPKDRWKIILSLLIGITLILMILAIGEWWFKRQAGFIQYAAFGIPLPASFTIHGIDVSSHQRTINWQRVKNMQVKGVKIGFAFIKATEGISNTDPHFNKNWQRARESGIPAGAYHFFIATKNGKSQARHFIKNVSLKKGDLPPVVDIEESYGTEAGVLKNRVHEFLELLEQHYRIKPIIYTNIDFYNTYLDESFDAYPLWVAHYINKGRPRINRDWTFWQHNEAGTVNGINAKVDFNVFKGDSMTFKQLLIP